MCIIGTATRSRLAVADHSCRCRRQLRSLRRPHRPGRAATSPRCEWPADSRAVRPTHRCRSTARTDAASPQQGDQPRARRNANTTLARWTRRHCVPAASASVLAEWWDRDRRYSGDVRCADMHRTAGRPDIGHHGGDAGCTVLDREASRPAGIRLPCSRRLTPQVLHRPARRDPEHCFVATSLTTFAAGSIGIGRSHVDLISIPCRTVAPPTRDPRSSVLRSTSTRGAPTSSRESHCLGDAAA